MSENRVQFWPLFQLWCRLASEEQYANIFYLNVPNKAGKHFRSVTTDLKDMYIDTRDRLESQTSSDITLGL